MHIRIKTDLFTILWCLLMIGIGQSMTNMYAQAAILIVFLIYVTYKAAKGASMFSETCVLTEYMDEITASDGRKSDIAVASYRLFRESRGWPVINLQPVC